MFNFKPFWFCFAAIYRERVEVFSITWQTQHVYLPPCWQHLVATRETTRLQTTEISLLCWVRWILFYSYIVCVFTNVESFTVESFVHVNMFWHALILFTGKWLHILVRCNINLVYILQVLALLHTLLKTCDAYFFFFSILGIIQIQTYTEPMFMTVTWKNASHKNCRKRRNEKWLLQEVGDYRQMSSSRKMMKIWSPRRTGRRIMPQVVPPSWSALESLVTAVVHHIVTIETLSSTRSW